MPSFEEAKKRVGDLVVAKGFGNTPKEIPNKLLFAFIELGEASDSWKKGKPTDDILEELDPEFQESLRVAAKEYRTGDAMSLRDYLKSRLAVRRAG
jgi:hypothetical protein